MTVKELTHLLNDELTSSKVALRLRLPTDGFSAGAKLSSDQNSAPTVASLCWGASLPLDELTNRFQLDSPVRRIAGQRLFDWEALVRQCQVLVAQVGAVAG